MCKRVFISHVHNLTHFLGYSAAPRILATQPPPHQIGSFFWNLELTSAVSLFLFSDLPDSFSLFPPLKLGTSPPTGVTSLLMVAASLLPQLSSAASRSLGETKLLLLPQFSRSTSRFLKSAKSLLFPGARRMLVILQWPLVKLGKEMFVNIKTKTDKKSTFVLWTEKSCDSSWQSPSCRRSPPRRPPSCPGQLFP